MDDQAHRQAQEAVYLAHPLAVAAGQIVVDGDDMHALAGQGVEIGGQNGHQGLALAGLHFGDAALMQNDAANELHPEGLHAQNTPGRLPRRSKGLRQDIVKRLPLGKSSFEFVGLGAKLRVAELGIGGIQLFDGVRYRIDSLQFTVGIASEQLV